MPPSTDPTPNALAVAFNRLAAALEKQTEELRKVDAKRSRQLDSQTRGLRRMSWLMMGKAVTLVVILSAVYPHVPLLRIYEHNQVRQAEVVRQLNCNMLWANGTRLSPCADVFAILDAQARHDGVPIPGMSR